ncbi:MAG: hypothetical protein QM756_09045 [Polyangiaceae bacterium]
MSKAYGFGLFGLLWLTALAEVAHATDAPGARPLAGVATLGSDVGAGLALDARLRFGGGYQLGVGVSGQALSVAYFGGQKARGVAAGEAELIALLPWLRAGAVELDLRLGSGLRVLRDGGELDTPARRALRSVSQLGCFAHVRIDQRHLLRAGALLVVELETEPTVALADQMQLLSLGFGRALGRDLLLYANVEAGGSYGFDGDNGKAVLRGSLGLRLPLGGDVLGAF